MNVILGVDQGGTKTMAMVCRVDGCLLGLEALNIQINGSVKENIDKTAHQLELIRKTDSE